MAPWVSSSRAVRSDQRSCRSVKPISRWYQEWCRCHIKRDTGILSRYDGDKTWPQRDKAPGKNDKSQQKDQVISGSHQWLKFCRSVQEGGTSNFILRFCAFCCSEGIEAYVKHLVKTCKLQEINKSFPLAGKLLHFYSKSLVISKLHSIIPTTPSLPVWRKTFYWVESSSRTASSPSSTRTRPRLPPAVRSVTAWQTTQNSSGGP